MSLADADWSAFTRAGNIQETWIVRLYHDAAGATDYIQLSDRDFTHSSDAASTLGCVTDWGDVRRSIDLAKFAAKIDNMSLTLANTMYHGAALIEELRPGSTRKYINRKVEVYSQLNGAYVSRMQIYNGRLRDISWTADEIRIEIEQAQPWDFIQIPDTKDSRTSTLIPVVYGDFINNSSLYTGAHGFCSLKKVWPVKVVDSGIAMIGGFSVHEPGSLRMHFFEKSADKFVPLVNADDDYFTAATAQPGEDYYGLAVRSTLRHAFYHKPTIDADNTNSFSSPENAVDLPTAFDSSHSTYATHTIIMGNYDAGSGLYYDWDMLPLLVPATECNMSADVEITIGYRATLDAGSVSSALVRIREGSTVMDEIAITVDGSWDADTLTFSTAATSNINISFIIYSTQSSTSVTIDVYDVILTVKSQLDTTGDMQAQLNALKDVEYIYCGGDGLTRSWTTGAATEIQELHRDVLHRFCGHTTTPDGWTALDTARSGWTCRWWTHEQMQVQEVLEQAQFEGAFIFIWSMTTAGTGRYLFVKDTYSSADVAATLSERDDTEGLEYSHTPFDELVTKQIVNYERHPADSRYISSYTYTNSTARTNWNIQTLENVETVELDMLVSQADTWAGIRDNIFGDLKRIVSCAIINPRYFILEVGDIVQFADDDRYYMITDERRTPGRLSITAREVYV